MDCLDGPVQGRRFDVGKNASGVVIPLFSISDGYRGCLFLMLGNMGAGYGSVKLNIPMTSLRLQGVSLKCHANVIHHVKALGVTLTLPKFNNKAASKLNKIKEVVKQLKKSDIAGF